MLSGVGQAIFGAFGDQATFEMRNGAEDMEHELSCGGCRVNPFLEADQIDLSGFEVIDGFQELLERAPQAIEADDGEGIVGSGLTKQGCQTGPVERLAGDHVLEHANGTVLQQPVPLAGQILVGGRDPRVSEDVASAWHGVSKTAVLWPDLTWPL